MKNYLNELNGILECADPNNDNVVLMESIDLITKKIEKEAQANTDLIKNLLVQHLPVFQSGVTNWKISISESNTGMDCEVVEHGTEGATTIATNDSSRKILQKES